MEHALTEITDYLLRQSWQIAAVFVLVAAGCWALRKASAHWRYLLWLVVLLKCLVPPLVIVPLAVLPQAQSQSIEPAHALPASPVLPAADASLSPQAPSEAPVWEPLDAYSHSDSDIEPAEASSHSAAVSSAAEPAAPDETQPGLTVRQWAAVGWIAGAGVFGLFVLLKAYRMQRRLKRIRRPAGSGLQDEVTELSRRLGLRGAANVWLVDGIGQPFVWGLLRGNVYLPGDFAEAAPAEHRRGILMHELAHVSRLDAAVNALQILVQVLFFFHPLIWWANRRIRAEREKCCDETAIAALSARPKQYSTAIVDVLVNEYESTRPISSLAVAGPAKNIEERIKTIMKPDKRFYKRPTWLAIVTALLLAAFAVPTALTLTARAEKPAKQPAKVRSVAIHVVARTAPDQKTRDILITQQDIREYDWATHTIHLRPGVAGRVLYSPVWTGRFEVVVDARTVYRGNLSSVLSSNVPKGPFIHVGPTAGQFQPKDAIRIYPPPQAGQPDPRNDNVLRQALQDLGLLKNGPVSASAATAPPATQPATETRPESERFLWVDLGPSEARAVEIARCVRMDRWPKGKSLRAGVLMDKSLLSRPQLVTRVGHSFDTHLFRGSVWGSHDWRAGRLVGGRVEGELRVQICLTPDPRAAHELCMVCATNTSLPTEAWVARYSRPDTQASVGDLSFGAGAKDAPGRNSKTVAFFRDNLFVRIDGRGALMEEVASLAVRLDNLIQSRVTLDYEQLRSRQPRLAFAPFDPAFKTPNVGPALGYAATVPVGQKVVSVKARVDGSYAGAANGWIDLGTQPARTVELWVVTNELLAASAARQNASQPAAQPAPADKAAEADRTVWKRLRLKSPKISFDGIALGDVLDFFRNVSNCSIHVKWIALEKAGITKDSKVDVHLTNVTLEKAIRTVLDDVAGPGKLGFVVSGGVITISTQTDLDRATLTRVYDIRDLILRIPKAKPVSLGSLGWPKQKTKAKDKEPAPTKAELTEEVINLIKGIIAPDSWQPKGEIGSIRLLGGQLIITQAPRHHKSIQDLLEQLREGRSLQILVEARFIDVLSATDKQLTERLTKQTKATFKKGKWDSFLSGDDVNGFIKEAVKTKYVRLLTAPRITLYNRQRAYVTVTDEKKTKLPLLDNQNKWAEIPYRTGTLLDVEATASKYRRYVTLTFTAERGELTQRAGQIETSRAKATATVNVPNEKTLLLRIPVVKYRAIGIRRVRDPDTGKTFSEVVEKPFPPMPRDYVYVLIKPRIIIQREYEEIKPPMLKRDLRP